MINEEAIICSAIMTQVFLALITVPIALVPLVMSMVAVVASFYGSSKWKMLCTKSYRRGGRRGMWTSSTFSAIVLSNKRPGQLSLEVLDM